MIRLMVMEFTFMLTETSTEDIGNKIYSMDSVLRTGWMVLSLRVIITRVENTVEVNILGGILVITMENGIIIKYLVEAHMSGRMEDPTRVTG